MLKSTRAILILFCFLAYLIIAITSKADPSSGVTFNIVADEYVDMMYLVAGDLDLDNNIDLVFTGWLNPGFIAFGSGSGLYESPVSISLPSFTSVALDYVDTDTLLDIIGVATDKVYVLLNNGDKTFTTHFWSNAALSLSFVSTGYFNNDAFLDFAVSPGKVYFGNGAGSVLSSKTLPVSDIYGADVSDFNKDGIDDLIVLSGGGTSTAWILINDGDGNFTVSVSLDLGGLSISTTTNNSLADFNNDGNPDFALISPLIGTACSANYFVSPGIIGLGDGNGGLLGTESFEVCGTSYNMVTADVDGDHELDIVVANGSFKRFEVLLGNGDGTFQSPTRVPLDAQEITFVLAQGDVNRDGNPDFISGGGLATKLDSIYTALNMQPERAIIDPEMVVTGYTSVRIDIINPSGDRISRLRNTVAGARYDRLDKNLDGVLDVQTYDYNLQYGDYTLIFRKNYDIASPATFDATIRIGDSRYLTIFKDYETPGTAKSSAADDSIVFYISINEVAQTLPESGEMVADNTPLITWSGLSLDKSGMISTYELQLDSKFDFSSPLVSVSGLSSKMYSVQTALNRDAVYYWRVRGFDGVSYTEWSNGFALYVSPFYCGDVNNDGSGPNILDLNYLVNYIFRGGPSAEVPENSDLNGDGDPANILDLNRLVNYIFRGQSSPSCGI